MASQTVLASAGAVAALSLEAISTTIDGLPAPPRDRSAGEESQASDVTMVPAADVEVTIGPAMLVLKGEDKMHVRSVVVHSELLHIALVADGHGGKEAAVHAKAMVIDALLEGLDGPPEGELVQKAGELAFKRCHAEVLAMMDTTAGATLTVCVVNPIRTELTVLHCGDSVARLVPRRSPARALCEDHRIDSSDVERARLSKLGGKIARAMDRYGRPSGPLRLWPGGVAQARAIGDRDVGAYIDPHPHALTTKLPPGESCAVVVCSDGVWDSLLPTAVDALARSSMSNDASASANLIVGASLTQRHAYSQDGDRMPRDDTTCIVLRIEDVEDKLTARRGDCCC